MFSQQPNHSSRERDTPRSSKTVSLTSVLPEVTSENPKIRFKRAGTNICIHAEIEQMKETFNRELAIVARAYGGTRIMRELSQPWGHVLVKMNLAILGENNPLFVFPNMLEAHRFTNDPRVIQCVGPSGGILIIDSGPIADTLLSIGRFFVGIKEKFGSGWSKRR